MGEGEWRVNCAGTVPGAARKIVPQKVTREGAVVRLTRTEWPVLEVLARDVGWLVPQQVLLEQVWDPGQGSNTQYLAVYLAALRASSSRSQPASVHLIAEPGQGHRLGV